MMWTKISCGVVLEVYGRVQWPFVAYNALYYQGVVRTLDPLATDTQGRSRSEGRVLAPSDKRALSPIQYCSHTRLNYLSADRLISKHMNKYELCTILT